MFRWRSRHVSSSVLWDSPFGTICLPYIIIYNIQKFMLLMMKSCLYRG